MLHLNLLRSLRGSKVQFIRAVSNITASILFFTILYTSVLWAQFTPVQLEEFTNLRPTQETAQHYADSHNH